MAHVADWKREEVKEIQELVSSYDVIGMVDLLDIPARQLQTMRKSLKDKAVLRMSKKTLIDLALDDCEDKKENIKELTNHMDGQPAMIFTDMNPFKLYKILEDSKTPAPAKAGSIAPQDIIVPAGDTGFQPGPILGELQQVGIPAKIDKGSIVVTKDHVACEEGEVLSSKLAGMLARLGINPIEVGINLNAAYEDSTIYTADLLAIDEEQTLADVQNAARRAFNLSVNAAICTSRTMSAIINNAEGKALNLAINAGIANSKTADKLLAKAYAQMLALARGVSEDALDDDLQEKLSASAVAAPVAAPVEETEEEVEEEEEEASEEEAAAGLGALFG